jgi:small-conductance mechanosensitive channel
MLRWFKNKNTNFIKKISWILPIVFIPFMATGYLLFALFSEKELKDDTFIGLLGFTLFFGYVYVILVHFFSLLFTRLKLIKEEA